MTDSLVQQNSVGDTNTVVTVNQNEAARVINTGNV